MADESIVTHSSHARESLQISGDQRADTKHVDSASEGVSAKLS